MHLILLYSVVNNNLKIHFNFSQYNNKYILIINNKIRSFFEQFYVILFIQNFHQSSVHTKYIIYMYLFNYMLHYVIST